MTTEQVEEKVRETLHAVTLDHVQAPADLAEKVVRRRGRRRLARAAGAAVAVAAITVGAVFGFGGDGAPGRDRPVPPAASPDGWKPWQSGIAGVSERGCLVDGSALYCAGSTYDAAKIDAGTGERLWTVKVNREGEDGHPFAARDGVVYAYRNHTAKNLPNGDYAGGTDLMALDAGTGRVLWTVRMSQDERTEQAAMLIDGAVLANTPSTRTMSALDPLTGKEKWRHTWDKGTACQRTVLTGVPYLVCMRDAEKPDHTDVLRLDPATGSAEKVMTLPGAQGLIGASQDRMVLSTWRGHGKDRRLTVVSGSGEHTSHSYRTEGEPATVDVLGDRLLSVSWQGKASAYSLTTGKTLWTRPVGFRMPDRTVLVGMAGIASPVVSATRQVVYFLNPAGDLSGLDLRTGELLWRGHADTGKPSPVNASMPQLLRYENVLIARNGSRIVSLLPKTGD